MSYFQIFHFSIFSFPEVFFPQNAAFPGFCTLECLISKVLIFLFLASQKLFFAKRCIAGVLDSGMSYFQSFRFSIFSFPEVFFPAKTLHFRSSALWNVLFPKLSFFYLYLSISFFSSNRCISGVLRSVFFFFICCLSIFLLFPYTFFFKTLHFRSSALWNVLFPKFSFFDF